MHRHLYSLLKQCPQTENEVVLSDDIKQHILDNKVYKFSKPDGNVIVTSLPKQRKQTIHHSLRVTCWNKYVGEEIGRTVCLCCRSHLITQLNFHCGHVLAEANGGTINIDNLRPVCGGCNSSMGTQNMQDFARDNFNVEI
jgi:hypothetical protein